MLLAWAMTQTKLCQRCIKDLPLESFYTHNGKSSSAVCKPCKLEESKLKYHDPEEHKRQLEVRLAAQAQRKLDEKQVRTHKTCTLCHQEKPLGQFYKALGAPRPSCKVCDDSRRKPTPKVIARKEAWAAKVAEREAQEALALQAVGETKFCEECRVDRPVACFYVPKKGKPCSPLCKSCLREDLKLSRSDPEQHRQKVALRLEERLARDVLAQEAEKLIAAKVCTCCKVEKTLGAFRAHRGLYGRSSYCRRCEQKAAREYCKQNGEALRARAKVWRDANPEKIKAIIHRRRARQAALPDTLTENQWKDILVYFDYRCAYCLKKLNSPTLDHVIAMARGGGTTEENSVPACGSCNSSKHDRLIFSMLERA